MPRKRRFYQPGVPVHVFQRGHNKEAVFFNDQDYLAYLRFLKASADALGCLVHAYVLMTNHVHLLVMPTAANDISLLFQATGRHYVPYSIKLINVVEVCGRVGIRGTSWNQRIIS